MDTLKTNNTGLNEISTKQKLLRTTIYIAGVLAGLVALTFILRLTGLINIIALRITTIYIIYLCMAALVYLACLIEKKRVKDLGFFKEKLHLQILIGMGIAVILSFLIGALPILISGGSLSLIGEKPVGTAAIIFDIITPIIFVGLVEELIFRGYIQTRINELINRKYIGVLLASAFFGIWHIINGTWIQVAFTFVIGCVFGFCREYLKNCSLLSVIIAHGVYDALLVVITIILL